MTIEGGTYNLHLRLLATGSWAKRQKYRAMSARTLCFTVHLSHKENRDYEDLQIKPFVAFSLSASPRIGRGGDQCFGSLVEQYRDRVPPECLEDFDHLYHLWREYHLNDLTPGTKTQMSILSQYSKSDRCDYDRACSLLKAHGILVDRGYKYGSGWLFRAIPDEDLAFLQRVCQEWGEQDD